MSEEISKVATYDPSNPYSVLNPNAAPHVIDSVTQVGPVPSYESMLLEGPADEAEGGSPGRSLKQKAAAAVLLASGGIHPTGEKVKEFVRGPSANQKAEAEELPPPKPKEPKQKKRFFNY